MVICDDCSNSVDPTANYCPECGSELSPTRKDWSDGFLSLIDRGHIQEAIDGNDSPPRGYHDRLHETVRHALADFCLLDRWDDFDNLEALIGDIAEGEINPDDVNEIDKLARLTCPHRFMINALGTERFAGILELSVLLCMQDTDRAVDTVSVSIDVEYEDG